MPNPFTDCWDSTCVVAGEGGAGGLWVLVTPAPRCPGLDELCRVAAKTELGSGLPSGSLGRAALLPALQVGLLSFTEFF